MGVLLTCGCSGYLSMLCSVARHHKVPSPLACQQMAGADRMQATRGASKSPVVDHTGMPAAAAGRLSSRTDICCCTCVGQAWDQQQHRGVCRGCLDRSHPVQGCCAAICTCHALRMCFSMLQTTTMLFAYGHTFIVNQLPLIINFGCARANECPKGLGMAIREPKCRLELLCKGGTCIHKGLQRPGPLIEVQPHSGV